MIVLIEGLDGVGKTTVSKLLAEKLSYIYIHESHSDDNVEKEGRIKEFSDRLSDGNNYVYDRSTLIDDFVYAFLNKEESSLVKRKEEIIDILHQSKIFHLEIDEDVRKKRFEDRGDEFVTNETVEIARREYEKFYERLSNVEFVKLCNDNEKNVNELIRRIKND